MATSPSTRSVDRRENLTEEEFITSYLKESKPVVFSGQAADWACTKKWNFEYLATKMPNTVFTVFDSPGLVEKEFETRPKAEKPYIVEKITAQELAESIKSGGKKYLRFSTVMDDQQELINDLDLNWLKKMRRCLFGICYQNFIGAAGRVTPLHAESTALFYVMADGEKKWTLIPAESTPLLNPEFSGQPYFTTRADLAKPDLENYPCLLQVTQFDCHLKKGDILFVPAWMWHRVENVTDSWGMSYSFTNLQGFIKHPAHVFVRAFLSKPSFWANLFEGLTSKKVGTSPTPYVSPKIFRD